MLRSDSGEKAAKKTPTSDEIRERAFEIHIERGGLHGGDLEDWLQAERELQQKYQDNKNGRPTK